MRFPCNAICAVAFYYWLTFLAKKIRVCRLTIKVDISETRSSFLHIFLKLYCYLNLESTRRQDNKMYMWCKLIFTCPVNIPITQLLRRMLWHLLPGILLDHRFYETNNDGESNPISFLYIRLSLYIRCQGCVSINRNVVQRGVNILLGFSYVANYLL